MQVAPLPIPHAFEFTPQVHGDSRGVFLEWFRGDRLAEATGRSFELLQANISVSQRGVVRGIHFADVPAGQAKYVTAVTGSVIDILVDLRVGSPTFGATARIELDDSTRRAVFVPEGLGHLFVATSQTASVCYLTTDVYRPEREHTLSVLDESLGLELPFERDELILSERDAAAPTLEEARLAGILPTWQDCLDRYAEQAIRPHHHDR